MYVCRRVKRGWVSACCRTNSTIDGDHVYSSGLVPGVKFSLPRRMSVPFRYGCENNVYVRLQTQMIYILLVVCVFFIFIIFRLMAKGIILYFNDDAEIVEGASVPILGGHGGPFAGGKNIWTVNKTKASGNEDMRRR